MMDSSNSIDSLIQQLKDSSNVVVPRDTSKTVTEDTGIDFVVGEASKTVSKVNDAVGSLIDQAVATADPELIASIAALVNASASNLDAINKLNIQNKKTKTALEVEKIRATAKLEETAMNNETKLIATRADIMKQFLQEMQKDTSSIDVESKVIPVDIIEEKD